MTDLRFAVRTLWRTPGFTAAAMLTFTLGIGVNLAVLAVVDRMMFRPLPYGDADRLVHIHSYVETRGASPATYLPRTITGRLRASARSLEDIATARVSDGDGVVFDDVGSPLLLDRVSYNLLQVLRVRPVAGRDFTAADATSPEYEVLLDDEVWARLFNRSPDVFTRTFRPDVGRAVYRIIGILPTGFLVPSSSFGERSDGIVVDDLRVFDTQPGGVLSHAAIARLRPGMDVARAQADVDLLAAQIDREEAAEWRSLREALRRNPVVVQPLRAGLFFLYRPYVWLIVAGVSAVFLLAGINLATLFLARGRSREHDIAIRTALGASRGRLVRAAVVETAVICLVSAAAAVAICLASFDAITSLVPAAFRGLAVSPLDARMVGIVAALALGAAIVAGGWPALRGTRADVLTGLRRDSRSSRGRLRGGATLLALEAAFGVLLVAGAATTVRSYVGMVFSHPGYEVRDLQVVRATHGRARSYRPGLPMHERVQSVLDVVRQTPGVVAAGAVQAMPVGRVPSTGDAFWKARGMRGSRLSIGDGFFAALGTRVLAGREIGARDLDGTSDTALVSRSGAHALWPAAAVHEMVGRRVDLPDGARTIVGVVEDVRPLPGQPPAPTVYVPFSAADTSQIFVTVAVRMPPGRVLDRAALQAQLDARLGTDLVEVDSVADAFAPYLQRPKFQAVLFGSVAAIGLLVAAVGLYAVAAFEVARRRFEVGVRVSLGATAAQIRRLVVRESLRPVVVGALMGLLAAWWAGRFLQTFVTDVDARDPRTLALVVIVLVVTAIVAAWLPATRASRIDPASVLRSA